MLAGDLTQNLKNIKCIRYKIEKGKKKKKADWLLLTELKDREGVFKPCAVIQYCKWRFDGWME